MGLVYALSEALDKTVDHILQAEPNAEPEELTSENINVPLRVDSPRPRTTAPLADRRIRWVQQHLATELESHQLWSGTEGEWCALALLVGIEIYGDDQKWDEELVHQSQAIITEQLRRSVAESFRIGDTRRLPDWRVIACFWGLDAEAINILATRSIPE
jgi:hypothetical protein